MRIVRTCFIKNVTAYQSRFALGIALLEVIHCYVIGPVFEGHSSIGSTSKMFMVSCALWVW
jgi:hypothetical protein